MAEGGRPKAAADWLDKKAASALLEQLYGERIAERTILSWCNRKTGALKHARLGSRIRIHKLDLLEWVNRRSPSPA